MSAKTSSTRLSRAVSSLMSQRLVALTPAHTKLPHFLQLIGLKSNSLIRRTCTECDGVPITVYIHIRYGTHTDHAQNCLVYRNKKVHKRYGTVHLVHLQLGNLGIQKVEMTLAKVGDIQDK